MKYSNKLNKQELNYLLNKIDLEMIGLYNEYKEYLESGETPPHDLVNTRHFLSLIYLKLKDQYIKSK